MRIKNLISKISGFVFIATLLFSITNDVFAQQPRGRTTDGAIIYSYGNNANGTIINVLAPLVFDEEFWASTLDVALWDTSGAVGGGVVSFADTTGGVMVITTAGADNDDFQVGSDEQIFLASNPFGFEATLIMNDVSGSSFFVGLADSGQYNVNDSLALFINSGVNDTLTSHGGISNGVGFVFDADANADSVYGGYINAGTIGTLISASNASNNTVPSDNEEIIIRLEVDASQTAKFFVNNTQIGSVASAVASTAKLNLVIHVLNREGSANVYRVGRYIAWGKR